MKLGRPKTGQTNLTFQITSEDAQLLATLATSVGLTIPAYMESIVSQHLFLEKSNPALAKWYAVNYPLLNEQPPPATGPTDHSTSTKEKKKR